MTDHQITPLPELVQQWLNEVDEGSIFGEHLANRAAQWGADQELEACCEWVEDYAECGHSLRLARRPKPPSLNSIAMQMLGTIERDGHYIPEITDTIRRALEALDD